jgi:hypothetical protein
MVRFRRMAWCGGLAVAALVAASAGDAQTPMQTPPPSITPAVPPLGMTLSSPIEISSCLCLEREIATRQAELTVRRNAYVALVREIAEAESAIARDRARVDVNDQAAVDAFKRRMDQLDAMKARQDQVTLPDYQAAVAGYNERVAQYTQRCSGRVLDPVVTEQVRANLICRMGE